MNTVMLNGFYSHLDDCELVCACQRHIEPAFNALYDRHKRYVYGVLNRMAPDLAQFHEDIVQEAFVRVWESIDGLRNPRAFKTWLNRLIRNLFCDELRKRPKVSLISIDEPIHCGDGDSDACREIPDSKAQPDERFELNEIMVHLTEALNRLPKQSRTVILLRVVYGLSYEEIAVCTHTGLGTVKSRIARAKAKMQSQFDLLHCA
jgi:RNA polymerase sigma-70 factor (ECF subfamily)